MIKNNLRKIVLLPKQLRNTVGVFLQLINPSRDVECIINFWNVKPSNESLKNFKIRHTYKDCVDMVLQINLLSFLFLSYIFFQGCKDFIIVSIVNNTLTIGCKVTILNGIKLTASRTLANDFENLFLSNNFSDLVISVDKRQIPAHKIILSGTFFILVI